MQNKKKHHYIPQHYLNGFIEPDCSPYIWVYEKGTRKPFSTTPKVIAFENDFYTITDDDGTKDSNSIENFLADQIESPAVPVLNKIRNRQMITDIEKETLSHYLVVLLKRVPQHRRRLSEKITPKTIDSVSADIYTQLDAAIAAHPERSAFFERRKEEARLLFEKYRSKLPDSFIMNLLQRDSARVRQTFQAMTWRFLTIDEGQTFLTSDNPFFYFEGMGIGKKDSEVSVPLAKDIALWATWRQDLKEGFFSTSTPIVKEINRRTASSAMRYVYSSMKAGWITTLVNKRHHQRFMIR